MSEYAIGFLGTAKILLVVIFSVFYWLGGRNNKALRRFIAPALLVAGIAGIACLSHKFSPYLLISYPLMVLAACMGYGADTLGQKLRKRLICGLLWGLAGLPIAIIGQSWALLGLQTGVAILFSVVLGVFSIIPAAQEEGVIGFMSVVLVPFYL